MSKHKLSLDEVEEIYDIIESDGLKAIFKVIDALVANMGKDVLNTNINTNSFSQLAVTKSKYDGAQLLQKRLVEEIEKLKGVKKNER